MPVHEQNRKLSLKREALERAFLETLQLVGITTEEIIVARGDQGPAWLGKSGIRSKDGKEFRMRWSLTR